MSALIPAAASLTVTSSTPNISVKRIRHWLRTLPRLHGSGVNEHVGVVKPVAPSGPPTANQLLWQALYEAERREARGERARSPAAAVLRMSLGKPSVS